MRAAERDVLLFILAVSAGSADGWSYFGLGHSFVANMTGNTVLLGISVFQRNGDLLHPAVSLLGYAIGVAVASLITRRMGAGVVWSKAISWTLLVEACLMAGAQAGWMRTHRAVSLPQGAGALSADLLLACVALAIGLQSGAMLQLKIPGVVTTYITGTWTTLMRGLVRLLVGQVPTRSTEESQFEGRLLMQAGILAVYFVSALLTGLLFRYLPLAVGALPTLCVLSVCGYSAFRCGEDRDCATE
jgi:uncharacterized membrane protein YoaK (UPF0700 family)